MDNKIFSQVDQIQDLVKGLVTENLQQPAAENAYKNAGIDQVINRKVTKKELEEREQVWGKLHTVFVYLSMGDFKTKKLQSKLGLEPGFRLVKATSKIVNNIKAAGVDVDIDIEGILKVGEEE